MSRQDVASAMSTDVLTVGPGHTLRHVAQVLADKRVGSAVVHDSDGHGVGIITERDILRSVARGEDVDVETAGDHQTDEVVFAAPTWTLFEAAEAMKRGGFRHLVVVDKEQVMGIISVRDIVKVWAEDHVAD
jgi:CBS domain-containing protein